MTDSSSKNRPSISTIHLALLENYNKAALNDDIPRTEGLGRFQADVHI